MPYYAVYHTLAGEEKKVDTYRTHNDAWVTVSSILGNLARDRQALYRDFGNGGTNERVRATRSAAEYAYGIACGWHEADRVTVLGETYRVAVTDSPV